MFFNLWKLISCFFYHFPLCPHFGSRANDTAKSNRSTFCSNSYLFKCHMCILCGIPNVIFNAVQINAFIISLLWSFLYLSLLLSHFSKMKLSITVNFKFFLILYPSNQNKCMFLSKKTCNLLKENITCTWTLNHPQQ